MYPEVDQRTSEGLGTASTTFNETLSQVLIPYGLKDVPRSATIGERSESVAEHLGSMIYLASWFIRTYNLQLDMTRVVDLICYHDLPELDCGDTPIVPGVDNRVEKDNKELRASLAIAERMLPSEGQHFLDVLAEYKAGLTPEAKFVRAIDKLDADLQFLGNKEAWQTWSDEFYRSKREPYYREVEAVSDFYDNLLIFLRSNGYLQPASD